MSRANVVERIDLGHWGAFVDGVHLAGHERGESHRISARSNQQHGARHKVRLRQRNIDARHRASRQGNVPRVGDLADHLNPSWSIRW
jgi:hypothetical protein